MAYLGETFNYDPNMNDGDDFSPIPPGDYQVRIVAADVATTKAGNGQYIKLRLDVEGPTHAGRVIFSNINIRNPSQKAEEIGRRQLNDIQRAIGVTQLQDSDQLVGGQMVVKVTIRRSEQYGDQNEVKAYKKGGSATPLPMGNSTATKTVEPRPQPPADDPSLHQDLPW